MTRTVFACDMQQEVGLGHISRCLGIAEAISALGGEVSFLGNPSGAAADLLAHSDFALEFVPGVASLECTTKLEQHCRHESHCSVVIDSYRIDSEYLSRLQAAITPNRLCVLDDAGSLDAYPCDLILNFTANAKAETYRGTTAKLLLGPRYFPAKQWHQRARDARQKRVTDGQPQNVLIFIAGNDQYHLTRSVVRALHSIDPTLHLRAIIPDDHADAEQITSILAAFQTPGKMLGIRKELEALFAWADVLVCGGGLTKYEAVYSGIPTATISLNALQAIDTNWFTNKHAVCSLGTATDTPQALETELRKFLNDTPRLLEFRQQALNCIPENAGQLVAHEIMSP